MADNTAHSPALYKLRKVTRIAALVILLLVVMGFFLPAEYRVERSIVVDASRQEVFSSMLQGDNLSDWMYIQNGQVEVFDGELTVGDRVALFYSDVEQQGFLSVTNKSNYTVLFDVQPKPKVNLVKNTIALTEVAEGTLVQWTINGTLSAGLLSPYLAMFANDIAGSNFERSLSALKEQIEQ
ncbi:SRPBCC family protein [Marinomonas algarum]|uniref:Polyketide cyclase n=1 Tax=Marinomonas algarum TaxID=2883105 RepID=A0A9X1IJA5_9GAMM|nr:SRPBCC family protein [Marinomonas algarum]MCB5160554.1 polyketide cyclase [Marinomonas algarum]